MLLPDTHTFIWLASNRTQLSAKVMERIEADSHAHYLSAVTVIEMGLLSLAGKINTYGSCDEFLIKNLTRFGIHEVPVDAQIAFVSTQLPPLHRDPFDRIIVATVQQHGMTILIRDRPIPTSPKVKVVWE